MKKLITIILLFGALSMQAMQESRWKLLPTEIKAHIMHYLAEKGITLKDFFNYALISTAFAAFISNHPLAHLKKYIQLNNNQKITIKDLFIAAILAGDAQMVKALIDFNVKMVNARAKNQDTMLILATKAGQREIVQMLLENGALVNALSGGKNALLISLAAGFEDIANLLMSYDSTKLAYSAIDCEATLFPVFDGSPVSWVHRAAERAFFGTNAVNYNLNPVSKEDV